MQSIIRVASPPPKAVVVYDGDCSFCSHWIHRLRQAPGDHLDYLPFQDPRVAARYPEVPRGQFEAAVQLIETDGRVYGGAEAVFRALACRPRAAWLLHWYQRSSVFSRVAECGYRMVARQRPLLSALTRRALPRQRAFDKANGSGHC